MIERYGQYALPLLTGLVVVSVALALAPFTWHVLGKRTDPAPSVDIAPVDMAGGADLAPIVALAPFGSSAPRAEESDETAAPSASALILKGVMMGRPAATSIAFIAAPGGETEIFRTGSRLPGGATLEEVQGDRVFLNVGGAREMLVFPEAATSRGRANVRAMIPAQFGGDAQQSQGDESNAPSATRGGAAGALAEVRARVAANPSALLDDLAAQPTADGYLIGEDAPPSVTRAGLRAGDLITRVNGETVGDIESDRDLFEKVAAGDRARLEVRRGDKTLTLSFPLR